MSLCNFLGYYRLCSGHFSPMCPTGSITSKNKGGEGGSNPLRKNSITNPLFLFDGFPNPGEFSLNQPTGPIQFLSRHVWMSSVCPCHRMQSFFMIFFSCCCTCSLDARAPLPLVLSLKKPVLSYSCYNAPVESSYKSKASCPTAGIPISTTFFPHEN